ncbi:FxLD family lanthipeptide [Longimycelium tulufanense]|nr:FxLD family lanthipeptide [Longimycelium tulufanense]
MYATDTGNDVLALDLRVIADRPGDSGVPCDTNDGCDPTCASSCVSS